MPEMHASRDAPAPPTDPLPCYQDAFINIKYMIPTYESCVLN